MLTGLALVAMLLCFSSYAHAAQAPWQLEEKIEGEFSAARTALVLGDSASPSFRTTTELLAGQAARRLGRLAPGAFKELRKALADARLAAEEGDQVRLAAAHARSLSALRHAAFVVTVKLAEAGQAREAKAWVLVRDYRPSTKFSKLTVEGIDGLIGLEDGELTRDEAVALVRKDLLDTYQARINLAFEEAVRAAGNGFSPQFADNAALAAGYWQIIRGRYVEDRGQDEARRVDKLFAAASTAGLIGDFPAFKKAHGEIKREFEGFVASPLTLEDKVRRAGQFGRFVELAPVEYGRGVGDGQVNRAFEVQEGVAFAAGAEQALADLTPDLLKIDEAKAHRLAEMIDELQLELDDAIKGVDVRDPDEVTKTGDSITELADSVFPEEWQQSSEDADYDLVDISLSQMLNAINGGEYDIAEQNRLSAYAFFEFGPELKLRGFDPGLSQEIEGMFWYGARGFDGLATQIANHDSGREVQSTLVELRSAIDDAHEITGSSTSNGTVITNAALIVFREGLEAILIIAAITASMIGARRHLRKPVYRGALLAIPVSVISYALMVMLLGSFAKYGEKVEAIVGLIAIGVLLVVMNWFLHKVYWTEWIASHRRRTKELTAGAAVGAVGGAATAFGLYALGFESVFREGMETVLFLQALQLAAGTGPVLIGVGVGLAAMAAVGVLTFKLESKLPYKRMLVVTGMLIALVLFTMVGSTVRVMQGVGWLPIHPIDAQFPLWWGNWLGIYPSWEGMVAQILAITFVIGSYFAAGWVSKRKLKKQRAEYQARMEAESSEKTPAQSTGEEAQPVA